MKVQSRFDNKKIGELVCDGAMKFVDNFAVEINGERVAEYKSLDAVAKDWKDYKPAEPLIKDEKIRKAVRAWAEANKFDHLIYLSKRDETYFSFMDGKTELEIMFNNPYGIIGLKDERNYTITELCGEEG